MCHWLTQDKNPIHVLVLYNYSVYQKQLHPTHYVCLYDKPINNNLLQSAGCAWLTLISQPSNNKKI